MRIYLGITKSGGLVKGSFEAGEILNLLKISRERIMLRNPVNDFVLFMDIIKLADQGYTDQRHAIPITDFRREEYQTASKIEDSKRLYAPTYKGSDIGLAVLDMPKFFQYIWLPGSKYSFDIAILMPISQEQFDMIASGDKKYLFMRVLPRALRGTE
jgi:hypothetical protein